MKVKSLSRVQLFATPWTVAYQAPPCMGFSRQEYWSGLPFPSPGDLPDPGIEPGSHSFQADAWTSEPPWHLKTTEPGTGCALSYWIRLLLLLESLTKLSRMYMHVTWVWASSRRLWRTGKPGLLQSMGSQSRSQLSDWTKTISLCTQTYLLLFLYLSIWTYIKLKLSS